MLDNVRIPYGFKTEMYADLDYTIEAWIIILSYVSDKDLLFLDSIKNKSILELKDYEISKYSNIKQNRDLCNLFIKYKNNECNKDEFIKICIYSKNSIRNVIKLKLSNDTIEYAYRKIDEIKNSNIDEYLKVLPDNIVDLFIYDSILEYRYYLNVKENNEKIYYRQRKHELDLRKVVNSIYE